MGKLVHIGTSVIDGIEYMMFAPEHLIRNDPRESQIKNALGEIDDAWAKVDCSERKLSTRDFVGRAPKHVVELELKKWSDAIGLVTTWTDRLGNLLGIETC